MKKRLLMLLILCPIYQISLYSMQQTQIQLRVDKNKLDVPYDFVTKQLGFLPKEMFDIMQMETDPTTEEKYVDVSPLLSPEEFNLLQKMIPVILPKQNLSVKTLIDQRVFDQLINQSNWPSVYTLADKTNFALLQRYLSYYIAQLYVDKKIDLNTILNLAPAWHNSIAKYFFLITKKNLEKVNKNSYGFSIQELIDWGYDFRQHYIATNQRLNLNNLRINSLDGFDNISGIKINHLQNLNLSANQLTYLPANFLANASRLEHLHLSKNQLTSLPANLLANAPQLGGLILSQNQLSSMPKNFLANAPRLEYLYLEQNQLSSLPAKFLAANTGLQKLNISGNKLDQKQIVALPDQAKYAIERDVLISKVEAIMDPKNQANPGAARIEDWSNVWVELEYKTLDQLKNIKVVIPIYDKEELEKVMGLPLEQHFEASKELKPIATQKTTLGELVKPY